MESPPPIQPILAPGVLPVTTESETAQRLLVIEQARQWIGTPYRQLAAQKGAGVDCAMLLARCWIDAGVMEEFDPRPYPPDWYLHRSEERYLGWMQSLATEILGPPAPGDVVLYKVGRCFSHSGIVVAPGRVVHAFAKIGYCMETGIYDGMLGDREVKFFDLWSKHR